MVSAVFADMRNVVFCAAIGSLTGFHVAGYLDPSAYARMRRRKGWTVPYFYLGHVVLHVVPVIVLLPDPARPVALEHGCTAALLHLAWYLITDVDAIYVPMRRSVWRLSMAYAIVAELWVPYISCVDS